MTTISDLKREKRWCVWRYEARDGKPRAAKKPLQPDGKKAAKTNDPATWAAFDDCERAVRNSGGLLGGVGLFFSGKLCGIDIDGNKETGEHNALEPELVKMFEGAYMEKSPSGLGLHILFYADAPTTTNTETGESTFPTPVYYMKNPHNGLEAYPGAYTARFFTFTGDQVSAADKLPNKTQGFLTFLQRFMLRKNGQNKSAAAAGGQEKPAADLADLTDQELLNHARNAKNGELFRALFDYGDTGRYGGDDSAADLGLCALLAFWTACDQARMDKLFRASALYRPKWNEGRGAETYGQRTIRTAIENCPSTYQGKRESSAAQLPAAGKDGKKTRAGLALVWDWMEKRGVTVRDNLMTGWREVHGLPAEYSTLQALEVLEALAYDELQAQGKKAARQTVHDAIILAADRNRYHPAQDMMAGQWDRESRLQQLYRLLGIQTNAFDCLLVKKWLIQGAAMVFNSDTNPQGADGVLVFQGQQGTGKTLFFRRLAVCSEWFGEGISINMDRPDTIIAARGKFITELGELDSTLKREQSAFKAFITKAQDEYRTPYARAAVRPPRRTSFCGTVNPEQFLMDETGTRRFWVVHPVIDLPKLQQLPPEWFIQLWREVYHTLYEQKNPLCFRLTVEERQQLEDRNQQYAKAPASYDELIGLLDFSLPESQWTEISAGDLRSDFYGLGRYQSAQIGRAAAFLEKTVPGIKTRVKHGAKLYRLPIKAEIFRG